MILLIDDAKEGGYADIVARNADAGLLVLGSCEGNISELRIDFDLGQGMNGLQVLQDAVANEIELPKVVWVVSLNPPGRKAIEAFLVDMGYKQIGGRFERIQ